MSLTVKAVEKLLRRGEPGRHLDSGNGVTGLYLVIKGPKAASWELRFQIGHRARQMGLGSARTFSLDEARARARLQRQKLADRLDPLELRKAERAAQAAASAKVLSFSEAAERYYQAHEAQWSSRKHAAQFLSTLRQHVFPLLGRKDVATIATPDVLQVLEQKVPAVKGNPAGQFWTVRSTTADRTRNRIELILDWCSVRGHRSASLPNPARWQGHLSEVLPSPSKVARIQHHPSVPYAELPAVMAKLSALEGSAARALMFCVLTSARAGEALGATWDEIDLANAVWVIPAARMKGRREHRVPLSPAALAILRDCYREEGNQHVFIGQSRTGSPSTKSLRVALRRIGRDETTHGFRSSFSSWAHECTKFPAHTIELSLAHTIGSAVEQAYRRSDLFEKRRALMEQWGKFCTSPPVIASEVVVPIGGTR